MSIDRKITFLWSRLFIVSKATPRQKVYFFGFWFYRTRLNVEIATSSERHIPGTIYQAILRLINKIKFIKDL